ncbi:ABC transporter permease [Ligaoa zhengdingensis]|uniref:ABC transporter permease n=1 Tax=Ligaoa zhengdingensis TaxID=2763658 RepID=UPI0020166092
MFRKVVNQLGIGIVIIVMFVFLSFASPYFFTLENLMNILLQVSIGTVIAVGMTFVIITGGIDLSVGSMVAFSCVLIAMTLHIEAVPVPARIALALLVGVASGFAMGAINGLVVVKGHVPAFIVTLGMMSVARGLALFITNGQTIYMLPPEYQTVTAAKLGVLPIQVIYALVVVMIASFILGRTKFGRYLYAIGGNKEAVRLSGINTGLVEFFAYAISGVTCGIGAILLVGRLNAGQPIAGDGYDMDAIAAAIIGGTSLSGGVGKISGTLMGAILMGMLKNGLNLLDVSQYLQKIIIGVVIVAAVLFDQFRKGEHRRKKAAVAEAVKA